MLHLLGLLALALLVRDASSADFSGLFGRIAPSVVLVMSFDQNNQPKAIGSGFFVGDGYTIATNFHVIQGASSLAVKLPTGQTAAITRYLASDPVRDLVLLQTSVRGQPLKLSDTPPAIGQEIAAVGNPKGLEGTISTGIVSGLREHEQTHYIQITAPISPGSSGGPVVDAQGVVIGVTTFYVSEGQSLNFAMPAQYIQALLKNAVPRPLSELKKVAVPKAPTSANAVDLVRVIEGYVGSGYFEGSIVNGSNQGIRNAVVLVVYYPKSKKECTTTVVNHQELREHCELTCSYDAPVHYQIHTHPQVVPPKLALRFRTRRDDLIYGYCCRAQILDYEVLDSGPLIPSLN